MSEPTKIHHWDPRAGGLWMPGRLIEMRCDGGMGGCPNTPARGARLVVPAKGFLFPLSLLVLPIKRFSTLHFCELDKHECTAERLLRAPGVKTGIERQAKTAWPHGVTPDFDQATVEWLLTSTPEYREYLGRIEKNLLAQPELVLL